MLKSFIIFWFGDQTRESVQGLFLDLLSDITLTGAWGTMWGAGD